MEVTAAVDSRLLIISPLPFPFKDMYLSQGYVYGMYLFVLKQVSAVLNVFDKQLQT